MTLLTQVSLEYAWLSQSNIPIQQKNYQGLLQAQDNTLLNYINMPLSSHDYLRREKNKRSEKLEN